MPVCLLLMTDQKNTIPHQFLITDRKNTINNQLNKLFPAASLKPEPVIDDATWEQLWAEGKQYGWEIHEFFPGVKLVTPPAHFQCDKESWAAVFKTIVFQGYKIQVPHYFFDKWVRQKGTHNK